MGGRGASSGVSDSGKKYGTEYKTLLTVGNVKFVKATSDDSELFETRTKGRVYVEIGKKEKPKTIYYFDNSLKKRKAIDLSHIHAKMKPHAHHGYFHSENDGKKGASALTPKEKNMVRRVLGIWDDYKASSGVGRSTP